MAISEEMLAAIRRLNKEELLRLNRIVVDKIRATQRVERELAAIEFQLGDRVRFKGRWDIILHGTIVRRNRTTLTVHTDTDGEWRVSPGMLTKEA